MMGIRKILKTAIWSLVVAAACTSCHTAKKTVVPDSGRVPATEYPTTTYSYLSDKLGIELSGKDERNITLYETAARWLGTPYRYGGTTRSGCDCSGLVMKIYQSVYGKALERNSAKIKERNCKTIKKSQLETGDLVFFATGGNKNRINHVGIYLKSGKFIHASSSKGVIVSDMSEKYYERTFVCAGRVN